MVELKSKASRSMLRVTAKQLIQTERWHMKKLLLTICIVLLAGSGCAIGSKSADEKHAADVRQPAREDGAEMPDLAGELLEMREKDQALRQQLNRDGLEEPDEALVKRLHAADREHAQRLKEIIEEHDRWPGNNLVGPKAADAAWLLAQHCDHDPALQKFFLEHLRAAVEGDRAPKRHLAYLVDRVRVNADEPQLYGTQFDLVDGEIELKPVEASEDLDDRRAEMGLPPMDEYLEQARKMLSGEQDASSDDHANRKSLVIASYAIDEQEVTLRASVHGDSDLTAIAVAESLSNQKKALRDCWVGLGATGKDVVWTLMLEKSRKVEVRTVLVEGSVDTKKVVECIRPVIQELTLELPSWLSVRPRRPTARAVISLRLAPYTPTSDTTGESDTGRKRSHEERRRVRLTNDHRKLKDVLRRPHGNSLKYCYEQGLEGDHNLSGTVRLRVSIDGSGEVAEAAVVESTLDNKDVEACMKKVTEELEFDVLDADLAVVVVRLIFTAK